MWDGTRRLLVLNLPSAGRLLRPLLTNEATAAVKSGPDATASDWARGLSDLRRRSDHGRRWVVRSGTGSLLKSC